MEFDRILKFVKNLFSGRIGRKNFFIGIIFCWFIEILAFIFLMLFTSNFTALIFLIITISLLILFLGLHVRRLHDLNLSWWPVLLFIIPPFILIIQIILFFYEGDTEENKYGQTPSRRPILKDIFNY